MANSFSNLFTIALAACGYLEACRQNLPHRYLAGYVVCGGSYSAMGLPTFNLIRAWHWLE